MKKKQEEKDLTVKSTELGDVVECSDLTIGQMMERLASSKQPNTYLGKHVIPKYPKQYIALPLAEEVAESYRGWVPLMWDKKKDELIETTIEKAYKAKEKVLAWKDRRIYDAEQALWKKEQDKANNFKQKDAEAVRGVDARLQEISGGEISATPLVN